MFRSYLIILRSLVILQIKHEAGHGEYLENLGNVNNIHFHTIACVVYKNIQALYVTICYLEGHKSALISN